MRPSREAVANGSVVKESRVFPKRSSCQDNVDGT